jgi:exopolyphosphatase
MALTPGIENLRKYLSRTRSRITSGQAVCCVLGNEAADLDSMASAVMYAYFRDRTAGSDGIAYVPVINVPREDYKLRTEAVYLFSEAGIDPDWLIFIDEIDLKALNGAGRLKVALVDHNSLAATQEAFASAVIELVDHHKDEGLFTNANPRIIEPVGSVATLVAQAILDKDQSILEEGSALLLLGTILLDTVNLDPEAKRATEKDHQAVETLTDLTNADRQALFDALQFEKFNVSALSTADLLRKDYKQWQMGESRVGISSVLLSIADWLRKDGNLSASLARYLRGQRLDVLIGMNAYTDPEFTRELVVYCPDEGLRARLLGFLEDSDLGLSAIDSELVDSGTRLYEQANMGYSRKKLQPLLDGFFASES